MKDEKSVSSNEFMEEKIKARPISRKHLVLRLAEVIFFAVIFGLVACLTMTGLVPFIEDRFFPTPMQDVVLTDESVPRTFEEIKPEDMLLDALDEPVSNEVELDSEKMLLEMSYILRKCAQECEKWLVQVAGVSNKTSWLESTKKSSKVAVGAIVADNGTELLILVEREYLTNAEHIEVTFPDGTVAPAVKKGTDSYSGLMVVGVVKATLEESALQSYAVAKMASSNNKSLVGGVILALGNTNGTVGSVNYGFVTATGMEENSWDSNYKLIKTDIYGSSNPNGFLVNLNGQIVGAICNDYNSMDTKNLLSAVGITELKKKIEIMSNGDKIPSFGIKGTEVSQEMRRQNIIPYGAYVTTVKLDSPAMEAGIQVGDVITKLGEKEITSMASFSYNLYQLEVGETVEVTIMRPSQGTYKECNFQIVLENQ